MVAKTEHFRNENPMSKASAKSDTTQDNPKTDPKDVSNQIKDPDQWTTGGEPMTGAQASYLKTLSEEAKEPEAFDSDIDKAEASKRIDDLRHKAGHA